MRKCCGMWLILAISRLKGLANAQVERSKGIYSSCIPFFVGGQNNRFGGAGYAMVKPGFYFNGGNL